MKKVKISINGRVQGVGFRYTTKQLADEIGINGMVRNEADGSVYIEAVGEDQKIDSFVERLKEGPTPFAKVEQISVKEDASLQNFISFKIGN